MRKKLLIILALFLKFGSYGQVNNGIISYKLTLQKEEKKSHEDYRVQKILDGMGKATQFMTFTLMFNEKQSAFFEDRKLFRSEEEELMNKVAKMAFGVSSNYYVDLNKQQTVRNIDFSGKIYNVISDIDSLDWDITDEQQKILNFMCYKANVSIPYTNRNNQQAYKNIIAWFAPEIPSTFGPIHYNGLPGLILMLEINEKVTLYASEISLNLTEGISLPKPEEGKYISEKEFEEITKEANTNFFND